MDAENEEQTPQSSDPTAAQDTRKSELRDLKPEKDPMGAGGKTTRQTDGSRPKSAG